MQNATLPRRIAAMLYDSLLVFALVAIATIPFLVFQGGAVDSNDNLGYQLFLAFVIYVFYVGFWTRYGRTLGMQSWRLQLLTEDGARVDFAAASLRFFAALLAWLPAGLGFLWSLWDKDKLAWHDRLSKTRLVYTPPDA